MQRQMLHALQDKQQLGRQRQLQVVLKQRLKQRSTLPKRQPVLLQGP
jgi:hypothetical protein